MKILVVHGEGFDKRGHTKVEVFGPETLEEINHKIFQEAANLNVEVEVVQSNDEQEVVTLLQRAHQQNVDAVLIGPGGFSVKDTGIPLAISKLTMPVYEMHSSNPAQRDITSRLTAVCTGMVCGCGYDGYVLLLRFLAGSKPA